MKPALDLTKLDSVAYTSVKQIAASTILVLISLPSAYAARAPKLTCNAAIHAAKDQPGDAKGFVIPHLFEPSNQRCFNTCELHGNLRSASYALRGTSIVPGGLDPNWSDAANAVDSYIAFAREPDRLTEHEILSAGSNGYRLLGEDFGFAPLGQTHFTDSSMRSLRADLWSAYLDHYELVEAALSSDQYEKEKERLAKSVIARFEKIRSEYGITKDQRFTIDGKTYEASVLYDQVKEAIQWTRVLVSSHSFNKNTIDSYASLEKHVVDDMNLPHPNGYPRTATTFLVSSFDTLEDVFIQSLKRNEAPAVTLTGFDVKPSGAIYPSTAYDDHMVTLVGIRRNPSTGKTQYLFQNSWGAIHNPSGVLFADATDFKKMFRDSSIPMLRTRLR